MCLNGCGEENYMTAYFPIWKLNNPDILCLQEVVHSPKTNKDWLTYRDGDHILSQRANFFRDVGIALPDHVAIFCPAAQGIFMG